MKKNAKLQAVDLRQKGYLYSEIAARVGVPKSTVYTWTHTISLSAEQEHAMSAKLKNTRIENVKRLAISNSKLRAARDEEISRKAQIVVKSVGDTVATKRVLCAMLYWCEGEKTLSSGVKFANSDPNMIRTFLELLRSSFAIDENKLRALIHLHEYHNPQEQLAYWSEITQIPKGQFYKPYLKPNTGINFHPGYPGCISIRYADSSLARLLAMIYTVLGQKIGA